MNGDVHATIALNFIALAFALGDYNTHMPTMLRYLRVKALPRAGERYGHASCNRVFIGLAIYLAYLFLMSHQRSIPEYFIKRILPFVCGAIASWGIYYGIVGLYRDAGRFRAIVGLVMNAVCLTFHSIYIYYSLSELYIAYVYYGGRIMVEFR